MPALFGPPGEEATVVWEGKYTRKRLCFGPWMMGRSGLGWVFVRVRLVYSVKPLSPVFMLVYGFYGGIRASYLVQQGRWIAETRLLGNQRMRSFMV